MQTQRVKGTERADKASVYRYADLVFVSSLVNMILKKRLKHHMLPSLGQKRDTFQTLLLSRVSQQLQTIFAVNCSSNNWKTIFEYKNHVYEYMKTNSENDCMQINVDQLLYPHKASPDSWHHNIPNPI